MKNIMILFCLLWSCAAWSQQRQLTGAIRNNENKLVPHASVTLNNAQQQIIVFTTSNSEGKFTITVPDSLRTAVLYVEVNYLGYKKVREQVTEATVYNIQLEEKVIALEEVAIRRAAPVAANGDTLTYDVSSFAREEDRSIGDVFTRMPGLSVSENGEVSYNGKSIGNLLIDDDNLMGGRYGLATRTITKDMIKSVQVIKNHQPIKVLQDKVKTDNVVINLVLKDENSMKMSGQGMLGGGWPEQFDAALNAMMFNKKIKMLNSLKSNNSGVDFRSDFAQLGSSGMASLSGPTRPSALLSAATAGDPDLPRSNYYMNRSGAANLNNLFHSKSVTYRVNMLGFVDRNTFNYSNITENYLGGNTIQYRELQNAVRKPFQFNTSVNAMVNKSTHFIENNLLVAAGGEDKNSYLDFNGTGFSQHLRERTYEFSNSFSYIPALKNKAIMDVRWLISYYNNPQRLFVGAGLNDDVLNNGTPYQSAIQSTVVPTFFNHIAVSYMLPSDKIRQNYLVGILNERQQLNSDLTLNQTDNTSIFYPGDPGNALRWHRDRIYVNANYSMARKGWDASLSLPLALQTIRYRQAEYALDRHLDRVLFNPSFYARVKLNKEDYVSTRYSYNNMLGTVNDVYQGAVLKNYRSLSAGSPDLQERSSSAATLSYNYERSILMFFMNAGIDYNHTTANTIMSSTLTNNIQRIVFLPFENDQSSFGATAGASKYLFFMKTTINIKANWRTAYFNQFVNNELLPFANNSFTLLGGIDTKLFKALNFVYNGSGSWMNSKLRDNAQADPGSSIRRFDQQLTLGFSPFKQFYIDGKIRQVYATQPGLKPVNYVFADAKMRYKLVKWRTDIDFDITNILNVKQYEVFGVTSNQFTSSRYDIRGMMGILRATFNL